MQTIKTLATAAALLMGAASAQAALVNRGGGMIYDTTLDITWLADMNYAVTSGYAAANAGGALSNVIRTDGRMGWDAAKKWANDLVYGGYDDWRLPTINAGDTSCSDSVDPGNGFPRQYLGTNCTGGELSHLLVADLGNKAGESVLTQSGDTAEQIANLALFSNVQSLRYWTGLGLVYIPTGFGWYFDASTGEQGNTTGRNSYHAVAVRNGDVAAAVPEPQSLALAALALAGLGWVRRRS